MDPDKLIIEARARIIWGEEVSSVRDFLISNGMSKMDADAKIKEFNLERNQEIRGIGLRNLLIGLALTGGAGLMIYLIATNRHSYRSGRGIVPFAVLGIYGLWKLSKGIFYLLRPQSEHKSISDMEE
jgi:hypothetical protein